MTCLCFKRYLIINDDSYAHISKIAEGGFSFVDLVKCKITNKQFALKTILCQTEEDINSAERELKFYKQFQHNANLISLHDAEAIKISDSSVKFMFLFPYYSKRNLEDEVQSRRSFKKYFQQNEVISTFKMICNGVKAFHEHQPAAAVHNDLKLANILLDECDRPVIIDFGSMTESDIIVKDRTHCTLIADTAAERTSMLYRPPELFQPEPGMCISTAVDIWSLGCILYALMYLQTPFENVYSRGDSLALATLAAKVNFPEEPDYNEDLKDMIVRMLNPASEHRPVIKDVIQTLDLMLGDTIIKV